MRDSDTRSSHAVLTMDTAGVLIPTDAETKGKGTRC
jgi:hypothetical protein